jgi:hypothetical protein
MTEDQQTQQALSRTRRWTQREWKRFTIAINPDVYAWLLERAEIERRTLNGQLDQLLTEAMTRQREDERMAIVQRRRP